MSKQICLIFICIIASVCLVSSAVINNDDKPLSSDSKNKQIASFKSLLPSTVKSRLVRDQTAEDSSQVITAQVINQGVRRAKHIDSTNTQRNHNSIPASEKERSSLSSSSSSSENVCLTAGCVKAAADILRNMDEKVNPCDDFYSYSCGNWIDSQTIADDKTSVSMFSLIQDELDKKLRALVEQDASENDPPIVGRMRNLYASCMNVSQLEEFGNKPLLDAIKSFGGWPVLGAKSGWTQESSKNFDWLDLLIKFRKSGFNHDILIDLSVSADFRNNTRHIIDVSCFT